MSSYLYQFFNNFLKKVEKVLNSTTRLLSKMYLPLNNFIKDVIIADIRSMVTGMTIQEVADGLNISYFAARQRIKRAGIKPICLEKLYPENTLELVNTGRKPGRPPRKAK